MQQTNKKDRIKYYDLVVLLAREQDDQRLTYQRMLELVQTKLRELVHKNITPPSINMLELRKAWREFAHTQNIVTRRI